MSRTGIYVYAVVPATPTISEPTGVAGAPVDLIPVADLSLVASEVDLDDLAALNDPATDPMSLGALAERHDAVVRAAMDSSGSVLPFRLGTVLTDRDAAAQFVTSRADDFRQTLARLRKCFEWGVKVAESGSEETTGAGSGDQARGVDSPAGEKPGTAYLARRREQFAGAERRRQQRAEVVEDVHRALSEVAVESVPGTGRESGVLLDEVYLVPGSDQERFLDTAYDLGERLHVEGLTLRVTGPWPPYSFARPRETADD
ncbi:MAG TPA: GvpL/GvpF family gas vesicle protein [Micromonosporaceae bacterium]